MKIYELIPTNGRKSFYGKAKVIECEGENFLQSYNTIVCKVDKNGKFVKCGMDIVQLQCPISMILSNCLILTEVAKNGTNHLKHNLTHQVSCQYMTV